MYAKPLLAILAGLILGSLLFFSGCGWFGNGYGPCDPYYGNYAAPPGGAAPVGSTTAPAAGAGGWRPAGGQPATNP